MPTNQKRTPAPESADTAVAAETEPTPPKATKAQYYLYGNKGKTVQPVLQGQRSTLLLSDKKVRKDTKVQ